ncbi:hypothetical protein B296_00053367 [Ensete ventricosum]|uniref:Uncharacterized protein n=1 Tax=Ensete ventricosum TaxID=4639 RepID=A0A426WVM8_ENSVE|nr:hypothetical protein B296_00053367 [Ensete ventricosum]
MVPTGSVLGFLNNVVVALPGFSWVTPDLADPCLGRELQDPWYVDTTALSRLRVGRPMMALYTDGSLTTMNDTSRVFDLGSPPNVTGIVVAPKGETESPVFVMQRPFSGLGSGVSFSCRGAIRSSIGTAGHDIPRCRDRILYESGNTFFCRVARGATSLDLGPSRVPFPVFG